LSKRLDTKGDTEAATNYWLLLPNALSVVFNLIGTVVFGLMALMAEDVDVGTLVFLAFYQFLFSGVSIVILWRTSWGKRYARLPLGEQILIVIGTVLGLWPHVYCLACFAILAVWFVLRALGGGGGGGGGGGKQTEEKEEDSNRGATGVSPDRIPCPECSSEVVMGQSLTIVRETLSQDLSPSDGKCDWCRGQGFYLRQVPFANVVAGLGGSGPGEEKRGRE
jgi:hypothetical protein